MNDNTDWSFFDTGYWDDNAAVNPTNAANTSPIITDANGQSAVSPGSFWNFLTGAVQAAGTAYAANVGQANTNRTLAAQQASGRNNNALLIVGGLIVAAILGGVLLLKRR